MATGVASQGAAGGTCSRLFLVLRCARAEFRRAVGWHHVDNILVAAAHLLCHQLTGLSSAALTGQRYEEREYECS